MKLKSLKLVNFRQFYGEQEIFFAEDKYANVTVIHGENGSGKTAILNAFKWVFYGETELEDRREVALLSERLVAEAEPGSTLTLTVEACFEHDNKIYSVVRAAKFSKSLTHDVKQIGQSLLSATYLDESGQTKTIPNPDVRMGLILPARLHPYFFFNGERIEKLASVDGSSEIQAAIRGMMGLEILERAVAHTSAVKREFLTQLSESAQDDLQAAAERQGQLETLLEKARNDLKQCVINRDALGKSKAAVGERLKEIGPVAEHQRNRDRLEEEIQDQEARIANLHQRRKELISSSAFLSISEELINGASDILEAKRKKGELPGNIKAQFLESLIERDECICGRKIKDDPHATECIAAYRVSSVSSDVQDAFIRNAGSLSAMKDARTRFSNSLEQINGDLDDARTVRSEKIGQLDSIKEKIKNSGSDDAEQLEKKWSSLESEILRHTRNEGELQEVIRAHTAQLEEAAKRVTELSKKSSAGLAASAGHELTAEIYKVLVELERALSHKVRTQLSELVNETFQGIMKKQYWAEISEDYSLRIKKSLGGQAQEVVNKSTGESQVASLSFIGGLIKLARERQKEGQAYNKGGVFPIVMDSPYGNLDPEYKQKVAEAIPALAEQVVIFVTNSQWREEVANAVGTRKGKEYTLIYNTPEVKEGTLTSSVRGGSPFEYTKVEEGYYD